MRQQREQRAERHRPKAHDHQQRRPKLDVTKHWEDTRDQEDAEFHHRGRMQIRTDRRGRRHGVRKPEVKRKLGRFPKRPDGHEHECHIEQTRRLAPQPTVKENREFIRPRQLSNDYRARQQDEPRPSGHQQRHARTIARRFLLVEKADEQKRGDSREFPKHDEQKQVP